MVATRTCPIRQLTSFGCKLEVEELPHGTSSVLCARFYWRSLNYEAFQQL